MWGLEGDEGKERAGQGGFLHLLLEQQGLGDSVSWDAEHGGGTELEGMGPAFSLGQIEHEGKDVFMSWESAETN